MYHRRKPKSLNFIHKNVAFKTNIVHVAYDGNFTLEILFLKKEEEHYKMLKSCSSYAFYDQEFFVIHFLPVSVKLLSNQ